MLFQIWICTLIRHCTSCRRTIGNEWPHLRSRTAHYWEYPASGLAWHWHWYYAQPDDPVWKSYPVTHLNLSLRHLPVLPPQCVLCLNRPAHQYNCIQLDLWRNLVINSNRQWSSGLGGTTQSEARGRWWRNQKDVSLHAHIYICDVVRCQQIRYDMRFLIWQHIGGGRNIWHSSWFISPNLKSLFSFKNKFVMIQILLLDLVNSTTRHICHPRRRQDTI